MAETLKGTRQIQIKDELYQQSRPACRTKFHFSQKMASNQERWDLLLLFRRSSFLICGEKMNVPTQRGETMDVHERFSQFFRETRRMRRISRIYRKSENRTGQSDRAGERQRGGRGWLGVEWLAVSGFGFHGSKPSLLYYGQPLTTSRTQRFASRTSMRVTDHARLFSACPGNSDIPICRKYSLLT